MITAKGLRQTSKSQHAQPTREDYDEPEQEKRRIVPLAFLLFLTGCAAYLKSFLPVKLEAHERQMSSNHDDADQSDPRVDDEIGAATEEDVATASAGDAKSSDNVVPIRIVQESGDESIGACVPLL